MESTKEVKTNQKNYSTYSTVPSTAVALGHIRPYRETSERLRGFENLSESLMGWGGVPGGGLKFV